jgi:hypothetical protein
MRALLFLSLLACGQGFLRTDRGREPIRSAFYAQEADDSYAAVLLLNSDVQCELPDTDDPAELEAVLASWYVALYREGALAVSIRLYPPETGGFEASYVVSSEAGAAEATGTEGSAEVDVREVFEAAVDDADGISRTYEIADAEGAAYLVDDADSGEVVIERLERGRMQGRFLLDVEHVSGRFEAERCDVDSDLFTGTGLTESEG